MKFSKVLFIISAVSTSLLAGIITLQEGVNGYSGTKDLEQFGDYKSWNYSNYKSHESPAGISTEPFIMTSSCTC